MPQPHPIARRLLGRQPIAGAGAVAVCLSVLACSEPPPPAPTSIALVLVNARVWTGDPSEPWLEALAVGDGRIVATGTSRDIRHLAPGAKLIDADRRLVLPGFIDSYTRVLDVGTVDETGMEWMTMEYLRGRDLGHVVDAGRRRPGGRCILCSHEHRHGSRGLPRLALRR